MEVSTHPAEEEATAEAAEVSRQGVDMRRSGACVDGIEFTRKYKGE